MWDTVHPLVGYAIVPATDGGMSSSAPTRDALVGSTVVGYTLVTLAHPPTHRPTGIHTYPWTPGHIGTQAQPWLVHMGN